MPAKGLLTVLLLLLPMTLAAQQNPPAAAPDQSAPEQATSVLTLDAVVREECWPTTRRSPARRTW